jgi:Ca2+-binding RTX toxin-like protein
VHDVGSALGKLTLIGGQSDDDLIGSTGNDRIYGGNGPDMAYGNGGKDVFIYHSAFESENAFFDTIQFFDFANDDKLDVWFSVAGTNDNLLTSVMVSLDVPFR